MASVFGRISAKTRISTVITAVAAATPQTPGMALANTELATKFVYGAERWPYFGGDGWTTELLPALLRHPSFEGVSPALARRSGHLHAFVVDTSPRSPQAKRRLTKER